MSPLKIICLQSSNIFKLSIKGCDYNSFYITKEASVLNTDIPIIVSNIMPSDLLYYRKGQIVISTNDTETGWKCIKSGSPLIGDEWSANTVYAKGQAVYYGENVLQCVKGGTSGASLSVVPYETFTDGSVTWKWLYSGKCEFVLIN